MPLPLTVSCFSKIQIGFAFLVPAHLGGPGERAVKRVCVCVYWSQKSAALMAAVFVHIIFKKTVFLHKNELDVVRN